MPPVIILRNLRVEDAQAGFFTVLSQLTKAPEISQAQFSKLVENEQRLGVRETIVAVNEQGKVIGTGAVAYEQKFIRGGAMCAHIEDIVVEEHTRGMHLGKRIITELIERSKKKGCYKVILDCEDTNIPFYQKCGFQPKEKQMALYL